MTEPRRIDLAHTPPFRLGQLDVRPGTRELVGDNDRVEVLEPRVMQVLVALAGADGAIVSRADLTRLCWDDRVVGEDAINRVISRLRRAAEGIGRGSFRVETITKVGYRLLDDAATVVPDAAAGPVAVASPPSLLPRRAVIVGGATLAVSSGAAYVWVRRGDTMPSSEVSALMAQAEIRLGEYNRDGQLRAVGLYRQVVALDPGYADGWGGLAIAYAQAVHNVAPGQRDAVGSRARDAAARALAIDARNGFATAARVILLPRMGNWLVQERGLRAGLAQHPDSTTLLIELAVLTGQVGRCAEALAFIDRARASAPATVPVIELVRIVQLWTLGRLDEADRAMDAATSMFPGQYAIWFTRFYLLMFTGRARQAAALCDDRAGRPTGIPDASFDQSQAAAEAIAASDPALIAASVRQQVAAAHEGNGYAENALQYASFTGDLDSAFAVAGAMYLGRSFETGPLAFSPEQATYSLRDDRRTYFLFNPACARMRGDPRFAALMRNVGLARYWRDMAILPDYQLRRG